MTTSVYVLVLALFAMTAAQSQQTDFSGHWVLVRPDQAEIDTLEIAAARELVITQTLKTFTVAHPSGPGSHPEAGTFEFGAGGVVGGLPGKTALQTQSVTFFGTQLMISRTDVGPPDASGARASTAVGSFWLLDHQDRLVIEFREERSKERPKIATRVYVRRR